MSYRFAIIGCGRIAGRHAEHIRSLGELVAVCDPVEARLQKFALQNGASPYTTISELLRKEEIDVVTICTPNGLHADHSIQALRSGCHVLCEKPLCISAADGRKMVEAATGSGKKLYVVKQNRYNPPVAAVRQLLDAGKLGKIHSFQLNCFWNRTADYYINSDWKGTSELDGGILFTQFSHFIDLLYWFLGEVQSVSGFRGNYTHQDIIQFEDTGVANLIMKNGSIGTINYTINAHDRNMEGSFTLFGEKGTVRIGGQYLNEIDYFSVCDESSPSLEMSQGANHYGFYEGSMSNHHIVYRELINALDDPGNQFLEAAEALKSVEIIEQIYSSSPFII